MLNPSDYRQFKLLQVTSRLQQWIGIHDTRTAVKGPKNHKI